MCNWRVLVVCVTISVAFFACGGPKTPAQPAVDAPDVVEIPESAEVEEEVVEAAEPVEAPEPPPPTPEVAETEAAPRIVPDPDGQPKAVVDDPVFNYGTRGDDEIVEHSFVLRNEGTGVLEIRNVRAGCGCTTTELATDTLAPGEDVAITASTNLRGRQGQQRMAVTVFTNDPVQPTIPLRIEGEVLASIMVEPRAVDFGRIDDDQPREQKVTIRSTKDDIDFAILSTELANMDYVTHEVNEIEPRRKYEIALRTTEDVPTGNHNSRMIIRTDARERAVLWLPIRVQVVGAVQIMPPVVNIRYSENPEDIEEQQLRITGGRVREFAIEDVIVPVETIETTLMPSGESTYLLRLANMPRDDTLEGKSVIIRTDIPEHEDIEIPFNIYRPRLPRQPASVPAQTLRERAPAPAADDADDESAVARQ